MSTTSREKIGVLLVHGIGEQGAMQHLEQTTAALVNALRALPGEPKVDIRIPPRSRYASPALRGVAPFSKDPTISLDVRIDDREVEIGLNEVWWADLDEPDGLLTSIRFWFWGLGQWRAKRYDFSRRYDLKHRIMPTFPWETSEGNERTLMPYYNRAQLFLLSCFFLMIVGTWSLAKYVISFLSPKMIKPTILVKYIGDVKLYQQRRYGSGAPLADIDQPPRTAITKRMVNALAGMALGGYDRWYVLAHSLGTVVAWDGLNQSPYALANCLSPDVADECRKAGILVGDTPTTDGVKESVRPPRPGWIKDDEVVDRTAFFAGMRGLCTYGAPLDKFAFLWPMIVAQYRDRTVIGDQFEWVNVYDPTDPVSGALDAFQKIEDERGSENKRPWPANYGYRAYPWLLLSHIRYLKFKSDSPGRLVNRLAEWLVTGDRFDQTAADPKSWMRPGTDDVAIRQRYRLQFTQWGIAGFAALLAFTGVLMTILQNVPGISGWLSGFASPFMPWILAFFAALFIVIAGVVICAYFLRRHEEIDHRSRMAESQSSQNRETESDSVSQARSDGSLRRV